MHASGHRRERGRQVHVGFVEVGRRGREVVAHGSGYGGRRDGERVDAYGCESSIVGASSSLPLIAHRVAPGGEGLVEVVKER